MEAEKSFQRKLADANRVRPLSIFFSGPLS